MTRAEETFLTLRRNIEQYLARVARTIAPGERVIEAGVGGHGSIIRRYLASSVVYQGTGERADPERELITWDLLGARHPDVYSVPDVRRRTCGTWDVAVASEVLEHVRDPLEALRELARAVRSGGRVVVTVPFFFRIHEPTDYWRFTPAGLGLLAERSGIGDVRIEQPDDSTPGEPLNLFMEGIVR